MDSKLSLDEDDAETLIPIKNELDQRICDTFMAHETSGGNKTVDVESLGDIIRALGLFPSNKEIEKIVEKTVLKERPGVIHLINFLPFIAQEIKEGKYKPNSLEEILAAFQLLDEENRGYFTVDQLKFFMQQNGEPLTDEEMAEMLEVAFDNFTKKIHYEEFVWKLKHEPKHEEDIYALAERVEAENKPAKIESKRRLSASKMPSLHGNF